MLQYIIWYNNSWKNQYPQALGVTRQKLATVVSLTRQICDFFMVLQIPWKYKTFVLQKAQKPVYW